MNTLTQHVKKLAESLNGDQISSFLPMVNEIYGNIDIASINEVIMKNYLTNIYKKEDCLETFNFIEKWESDFFNKPLSLAIFTSKQMKYYTYENEKKDPVLYELIKRNKCMNYKNIDDRGILSNLMYYAIYNGYEENVHQLLDKGVKFDSLFENGDFIYNSINRDNIWKIFKNENEKLFEVIHKEKIKEYKDEFKLASNYTLSYYKITSIYGWENIILDNGRYPLSYMNINDLDKLKENRSDWLDLLSTIDENGLNYISYLTASSAINSHRSKVESVIEILRNIDLLESDINFSKIADWSVNYKMEIVNKYKNNADMILGNDKELLIKELQKARGKIKERSDGWKRYEAHPEFLSLIIYNLTDKAFNSLSDELKKEIYLTIIEGQNYIGIELVPVIDRLISSGIYTKLDEDRYLGKNSDFGMTDDVENKYENWSNFIKEQNNLLTINKERKILGNIKPQINSQNISKNRL